MWQQQDWVFLLKPLADAGHLDAVRLLHILGAVGRPTSAGAGRVEQSSTLNGRQPHSEHLPICVTACPSQLQVMWGS